MEDTKKIKRGRKVKEDTLTISTFFMHKENYDKLTEKNKAIGHKYIESIANGSKPKSPATIKYNGWILRFIFESIKTDLDSLTVDDIDDLITAMNRWTTKTGKSVTNTTKKQYYVGFKRFLFWYAKRYKKTEYRDLADLIELPDKEKDKHKKASDMFTDNEVKAMIKHVNAPRNKAIISTLAESGCRIGELLAVKVGDITFTDHGCDMNIRVSKTEPRVIPLGEAAFYIQQYLSTHPQWHDKEAPLWITLDEGEIRPVAYHAVRSMIQKVALDVGITKRVHPHLFRHTAATALSKKFNEYEFRKFMGWSAKSTTPAEYVHLDDQDIKYAVYAKRFGLVEIVKEVETNKILGRCPKCGAVMPTTADICQTCKFIVNQDLRDNVDKRRQIFSEELAHLDNDVLISVMNSIRKIMETNQS